MGTRGGAYGKSLGQPEFESGSWLIRCGSGSQEDELVRQLPAELVLRQLRRFSVGRLLICNPDAMAEFANQQLGSRPPSVVLSLTAPSPSPHGHDGPAAQVDAVWDGDMLHERTLPERLRLIEALDRQLQLGGLWFTVAKDHSGHQRAWGAPLSAEEVVGYFSPAYHVVHQEQFTLGGGSARALVFTTLVFAKTRSIEPAQLDLDVHWSIQRIAAKRRAHARAASPAG